MKKALKVPSNCKVVQLFSSCLEGIEGQVITIETTVDQGLPTMNIVGLGDSTVKESRERIRSAIKSQNYRYPPNRITVNLAPASIKKRGAVFDLAISLSILLASGQISSKVNLNSISILGELSLNGTVRSFRGIFPMIITALKKGCKKFIVPESTLSQLSLIRNIELYAVSTLQEAVSVLEGRKKNTIPIPIENLNKVMKKSSEKDLSQIKGHVMPKRALEIAASGGHNVLFIGPPGSGKTMLASHFPSILPDLTDQESLEVMGIQSLSEDFQGQLNEKVKRPFRSPHHSISSVGLSGGGQPPRVGEMSWAHKGVLFLDELTEFNRSSLEVLREPLEAGKIHIARSGYSICFPADFLLIVAMNPCPCGYLTDPKRQCQCSVPQVKKYLSKVSGPLLDRIDMHIEVMSIAPSLLHQDSINSVETSSQIKERVKRARKRQEERYQSKQILNAKVSSSEIQKFKLKKGVKKSLIELSEQMFLSTRSCQKVLKISRTIADLDQSDWIEEEHLYEATQYRSLDRKIWG